MRLGWLSHPASTGTGSLTVLEGTSDELSGRIQKRYGIAKEEAEKQVKMFRDSNSDLVSRW